MTVKENHLLLKDFEGTNQSAAWPPTYDPQPGAPKGVSWAILDSLGPESNSFGQGTWSFRERVEHSLDGLPRGRLKKRRPERSRKE